MMQTSRVHVDEALRVEVLRVDDGRVDVGEDLEFARAAHVVAVARRAVGDDLVAIRAARTCPGSNGSIILFVLRHAADPVVGLDAHLARLGSAFFDDDLRETGVRAILRAARQRRGRAARHVEVGAARGESGAATTVGVPPSASSRMRASSGSSPSSSTPYCAAMRAPPPAPKRCSTWPQLRADVHAHVLDDAEHRHVDLLEHLEALAGVGQRDVLRRGHDDGAGHRHALRQRELDVAGARRHVDDQVVELAPVGVAEQLRQRLRDHRPAPDHGLFGVDQEADGHRRPCRAPAAA